MTQPLMLCAWIPVAQELPALTKRDETPIAGRPNAPATLLSDDVLVMANGRPRIDHLVGAEGSARRDWYSSTGVTDWMPVPGAQKRSMPTLTDEQIEFGLNNQLEDPTDEEAAAFAAGARWVAHVLGVARPDSKPSSPPATLGELK